MGATESKARKPGEDILDKVRKDEGKAYALKKLAGVIAVSGQNLAETVDSVAEYSFGIAQEFRRNLREWFELPNDLNEWSDMILGLVDVFEVPIKIILILTCIGLTILIVRILIEMVLDTVDMFTYCEEDAKIEPEVVTTSDN